MTTSEKASREFVPPAGLVDGAGRRPADRDLGDGRPVGVEAPAAGEADVRTPVESARLVRSMWPGSGLVTLPGTGHAVLNGGDPRVAAMAPGIRARQVWFGRQGSSPQGVYASPAGEIIWRELRRS